jgi:sarcosine oxidase
MSDEEYDVIVIGLGCHGSATLAYLAKNYPYLKVLGIEQFSVTHGNGSSHGKSRIYRQAYFEDPMYVPLLQRALELYKDLEEYHERKFPAAIHRPLNLCGGLMIGASDSEVIQGTLTSIRRHNLPHKILSSQEVKRKFEVFNLLENEIGIWEGNAGYLHPEVVIETYIQIARENGAHVRYGEKFRSFSSNKTGSSALNLTVLTDKKNYRCNKLVLTVGAWAPEIYSNRLPFPLSLQRRVLFWFEPAKVAGSTTRTTETDKQTNSTAFQRMPIYIWDMGREKGNFYGFPEQVSDSETFLFFNANYYSIIPTGWLSRFSESGHSLQSLSHGSGQSL